MYLVVRFLYCVFNLERALVDLSWVEFNTEGSKRTWLDDTPKKPSRLLYVSMPSQLGVSMWRSGTFLENHKWVHYWLQTQTVEWLSAHAHIRQSWQCFLTSNCRSTAVQNKCTTPSHIHPMSGISLHKQFHQAFPMLVLQVTNTGVRRPEYEATFVEKALLPSFQFSSNLDSLPD